MKRRITLVHGWGYDATLWREVVPLLSGVNVEVADLGFFGHPVLPAPGDPPDLAVGHSLGVLWWLTLAGQPWTKLLAINGFPRFTAADDFRQGIAVRVLDRMKQRFATAPAEVLADFQAACGGAGPELPRDIARLGKGLATLAEADGRIMFAQRQTDVFALAGRHDTIVPASMSEAAFAGLPAGRLRWIEDGGHLLPLTHPHACAQWIREVAA